MNIDEMEAGPELDALVAERVMEWRAHTDCFGEESQEQIHYWCFTRTRETHPEQSDEWLAAYPSQTTEWLVYNPPKDRDVPGYVLVLGRKGVFCPSRDIAAAWEVVEKLKHELSHWQLCYGDKVWTGWYDEGGKTVWSRAETAPLAICCSALKAAEWKGF